MTVTAEELAEIDAIAAAVPTWGNGKGRTTGPAHQILAHRVGRMPGHTEGVDADVFDFLGVPLPAGVVVTDETHGADGPCSLCNGTFVPRVV